MNTINNLSFFNKYKKNIFILLTLFFLFFGYLLTFLSNRISSENLITSNKPLITNTKSENININKIVLNAEMPKIMDSMPIYSSQSQEDVKFLIDIISQKFNLVAHENLENIWVNSDDGYFLSFSPISDQITLSNLKIENGNNPTNKEEAVKKANDFIDSLSLNFSVELDLKSLNSKDVESHEKNDETIIISYNQKLNGYDLYHTDNINKTITVFVTKNYQISKIIINNPSINIISKGMSKTHSINDVISNIENGKGTIINVNNDSIFANNDTDLVETTIYKVEIEYRDDINNNTIIPFYKFTGFGNSIETDGYLVEIIYPVVITL